VTRYGCAVLLLTLLLAPAGARGDDAAQPVPAVGRCTVPADPKWTPQEKFVWQRVCVGKIANFNNGPDYGGNLDPKRPQGLPDSRILRPAFLEQILLEGKYRNELTRRGIRITGVRFNDTLDLENAKLRNELDLEGSFLAKGIKF
jgi:hypothetical protein